MNTETDNGRGFCNSCVGYTDPRYNCLDGRIYEHCGSPLCGGFCEQTGRCVCRCHRPHGGDK